MPDKPPAAALEHAAETHPGLRRPHNEDAFGANPELGLFVVADGMGGHEAGEVASNIVVKTVSASVEAGETLPESLQNAHRAVLKAAADGIGLPGMGSTAVCAQFSGTHFQVAWAGDSRGYVFGKRLERLTRDHSLVQELVDSGSLSAAEARTHPDRSLITRALGMPDMETLGVENISGELARGQRLLLCSDGLTEELSEDKIATLLGSHRDLNEAVQALVKAALDAGGRDNITVMLIQRPGRAGGPGRFGGGVWLSAALSLLACGLAAWLFWSLL